MCNLYSITTNQAAIIHLFRVINRYVGNLAPMPGVFPDYPAPAIRNSGGEREMTMMRWGMPPPPRTGGPPVTNIRNTRCAEHGGYMSARSPFRFLHLASFAEGLGFDFSWPAWPRNTTTPHLLRQPPQGR